MTKIVFTFPGGDFPVSPFVFGCDGDPRYYLNYTGAYGDPPGTYFYDAWSKSGNFTHIYGMGDAIDLKEAFRPAYETCRKNGVEYYSSTIPCCAVSVVHDGNPTNMTLSYTYHYNPANPGVLDVQMHGYNNIGGALGTRFHTLNYYDESVNANNTLSIAQIRLFNCPKDQIQYEGSSTFYIGCLPLANMAYVKRQVTWLPDQLEWITNPEVDFINPCPFIDVESIPLEMMNMMHVGDYDVFTVEHHGFASLSHLPMDPAYIGAYGYTWFNTADTQGVYFNEVEWDPDEDDVNDSQDDTAVTNNYSTTTYIESSDPVPPDGLPNNSTLDTGFVHAYCLGTDTSRQLANYLLTDSFLEAVKHLYDNTIDYILSYVMIPVKPPLSGIEHIKIGGVDTEINAQRISNNFVEWDAKCSLKELWGGFPDYTGTRVSCYIPFVGVQGLNTDDVMDGELRLNYRIDVLTGIFNASLSVNNSRKTNGVLYTYEGCMAYNVPLFSSDVSNKLNSIKSVINGAVGIAAGGGYGAIASTAMSVVETAISKPSINRSGSLNGDSGFLGNYTPYLIVERPVQALPSLYKNQIGYPTREAGKVSKFTGYLEVETIDLSGIACTEAEKDLILQAFKEGVFV